MIVALSVPLQFGKYKKNYIFEKSYFDFPAMISSCLDVNVSCYLATSELSVCKACYRRLIKFKTASDHLEELKGELKGIFKDRKLPRTKRLLNVESDGGETQASCRGIGNPRNVCNSIRSIALVLLMLQPILVFLPRSANRYVIILRQDFLLVLLVPPTVFKVIHTDLCYKLPLVK